MAATRNRKRQTAAMITGVSASIVAPREFARRRWLHTNDTLWYYHAPESPGLACVDHDVVYGTLDPLLFPLVQFLHRRGAATTASCQGHFHDALHHRYVWRKLVADAERASTEKGLLLHDSETGEVFCLRDARFALPWDGFLPFLQEVRRYQSAGFLGFTGLPPSDMRRLSRVVCPRDTNVRVRGDGSGEVFVSAPNADAQRDAWDELTVSIATALGHCSVHHPRCC